MFLRAGLLSFSLLVLFPGFSFSPQAAEQSYGQVLCVGDVVWKIARPDIKDYGVEIFILPETASDRDYKNALYKTVTDSMDIWQAWVAPGTYKFVAKYFNFKKEVRTVYFILQIKANKRIKVMPTIEIGNK